jgi:omega-6 fatty acid desaturase (delta-12 desaturase)
MDPRLAPYAVASHRAAALDLATSVVPYLTLLALAYVALDVSALLTLAIGVVAGGFLMRTFIVFHDCTHGSFTPSRRLNTWIGRICGLLVWTRSAGGAARTPSTTARPATSTAAEPATSSR